MPEIEISFSEYNLLRDWLWRKNDLGDAAPIDHEINANRGAMVDSFTRPMLWMVDEEPLIIVPRTNWFRDVVGRSVRGVKYYLYYGNHNANQLEEAGIVRLTEELQQGVQTP